MTTHPVPEQNGEPILFLDLDGVLQTPALVDWREMEHCDGLRQLLRMCPKLQIVLTSTHREGRDLAGLRALFPADIAVRVIGATAVTAMGRSRGGRQAEIEMWLDAHPCARLWAAVDDEAYLYLPACPWLVVTSKWLGWTADTTGALLQMLGESSPCQDPTSTGMRTAPSLLSASQRCLPSMNSSSPPSGASTGNAGQSRRRLSAAAANHCSKNVTRAGSGHQGAQAWDAIVRLAGSMKQTWTGFRTKP